ncbi:MAG TPA: hypothetical protein VF092_02650 [Longimicrobium sp.]
MGETSFDRRCSRVELYKMKKAGIPEVFYLPVQGALPPPPWW